MAMYGKVVGERLLLQHSVRVRKLVEMLCSHVSMLKQAFTVARCLVFIVCIPSLTPTLTLVRGLLHLFTLRA